MICWLRGHRRLVSRVLVSLRVVEMPPMLKRLYLLKPGGPYASHLRFHRTLLERLIQPVKEERCGL